MAPFLDQHLSWVFVWILAWSLITFLVYGWDKRAARRRAWRVPEIRLHLLAAVGGLPGALIAQRIFRHKSRKPGFQFVTGLITALYIVLMVIILRGI